MESRTAALSIEANAGLDPACVRHKREWKVAMSLEGPLFEPFRGGSWPGPLGWFLQPGRRVCGAQDEDAHHRQHR
jgi:hypothetical protein